MAIVFKTGLKTIAFFWEFSEDNCRNGSGDEEGFIDLRKRMGDYRAAIWHEDGICSMPTSLKPVTDPLLRVRSPSHSNYRIIFLVSIFLPCFCSANTALPAQAIRPSRFDGRMENESGAYIASSDDPISALQGGDSSENGISPLPSAEYYEYYTQSGDTLYTVAVRFNAYYSEIKAINGLHLPERGLLSPGQGLRIPKKFATTTDSAHLFPDSEIVFSKTSANFSVENFILGKR